MEENGITGFGEAALPPYLPETSETVCAFFSALQKVLSVKNRSLSEGITPFMDLVNNLQPANFAAKAAVDIALHDLLGKTRRISLRNFFHTENLPPVFSSYTIGVSGTGEMKQKIAESGNFRFFKLKLNGENDKKIIETFLSLTRNSEETGRVNFCVDVNQAWKDTFYAMDMIYWLADQGAVLVEQPLPKKMLDETARLTEQSPVPVIADEAVQVLDDIERINGAFSGINIKLMKCGGMTEAKKMITRAKELKMKILIGCMSESSCAVTAAAHLSPFADWADLDGPYLINNDPFEGVKVAEGKIVLPGGDGLGVKKK